MLCCDQKSDQCTLQPTTCVDNYNHPASALCTDSCIHDPLTLKCTDGPRSFCNLVQFESPLEFIDRSEPNARLHRRIYSWKGKDVATVGGVVRGWFCGITPVPADYVTVAIESSTIAENGKIYTTDRGDNHIISDGAASKTASATHSTEVVPTQTAIHSEEDQSDAAYADTEDCDDEVADDDCCYEDDDCCDEDVDCCYDDYDVGWEEPCVENCVEVMPRGVMSHRRQRWSTSEPGAETETQEAKLVFSKRSERPSKIVLNTITITQGPRPVATHYPQEAPEMTITEAVMIISATFQNQTNRYLLSEATQTFAIVPPIAASSTSTSPRTSGPPRKLRPGRVDKQENFIAGKIVGIVIGSLAGIVVLFFTARHVSRCISKKKQAKRLRAQRDSNPVSSRITSGYI